MRRQTHGTNSLSEAKLVHRIQTNPTKPTAQMGFRPFRICDDNLTTLITAVRSGFLNQSITIAVFLDAFAGAFDNLSNIDLSLRRAEENRRSTSENLLKTWSVSVRYLNFVIDGELHGPCNTYKSTPQGSTLSLLLFDIYLRNLDRQLHYMILASYNRQTTWCYIPRIVIQTMLLNLSNSPWENKMNEI